jgi:hypothetical protein
MSAFIVEDKTINAVVTYLACKRDGEWIRRQVKTEAGFDLETLAGRQGLGAAMFELNVSAVTQRYPKDKASDFRPLNYKFALIDGLPAPAVIKALACWLYQCSEGDCPENELYKLMDKIKGELCYDVVCKTKEYDNAVWG